MHQSKITDFVNEKELSSGSEHCQTTDDIGPCSGFELNSDVTKNDKHKAK